MARYDYRLLLSEKNFLKVKQRARALPNGTNLVGIYYNDNELIFKTRSASRPNIVWTQRIQLTDASIENILNAKSYQNIRDLLLNSGMKIACQCEAWLYWGYKYMAWKRGYGIEKETRRPVIRNPYEQGLLCKHLFVALSCFPFWVSELASKYLNHYKSSIEQESEQLTDSRKKRLLRNPYGVRPKPLKW